VKVYDTSSHWQKLSRPTCLALRTVLLILPALVLPAQQALPGPEYAFVVTTDYSSAAYYSTIEILPPRITKASISPVSTDPIAHYDAAEDMIFVINRFFADNIQIVDPNQDFATIGQYSVGNGANPHDIRLAGSQKAYVSRFEWKTLLIVHPYTGDSLGTIDLAPFADSDGIPEMDRMEIVGDRLFVTLNCIDHLTWLPNGNGKIAVIDTETDTLIDCNPAVPGIQPIELDLPNPYSELRYEPCRGELIVGCLGAWGTLEGGVAAIDPVNLEGAGTLITEAQIGGDISDALLAPDGKGYAVVLKPVIWPDNHARLVTFDPTTASVTDTLYRQTSGQGSSLAAIEANRQREIYLCDRDLTQPGIRIFDTRSDTLITHVDVGVPPFDLEFGQIAAAGTHQDPQPGSPNHTLGLSHPNPFREATQITYTISQEAEASDMRLSVYDPLGRLIRVLAEGSLPAGTYTTRWCGTDRYGTPVAPGIYFARLRWAQGTQTRSIVLVK
jgi:hypothetical protein